MEKGRMIIKKTLHFSQYWLETLMLPQLSVNCFSILTMFELHYGKGFLGRLKLTCPRLEIGLEWASFGCNILQLRRARWYVTPRPLYIYLERKNDTVKPITLASFNFYSPIVIKTPEAFVDASTEGLKNLLRLTVESASNLKWAFISLDGGISNMSQSRSASKSSL